jgi:hypothetical protein
MSQVVMKRQRPTLPEEVLDQVIGEVGRSSELLPVVTVSRALRRITTPHLYKTIYLDRHEAADVNRGLCPLTYHLLTHPEVARLVHTFELRHPYFGTIFG